MHPPAGNEIQGLQAGMNAMNNTKFRVTLGALALAVAAVVTQAAGAAQPTGKVVLSRDALLKLADDYFAALVAHDPSRVPLASNVKIVENVTAIKPGQGL